MSSIPNNAMPHAGPAEAEAQDETAGASLAERASQQARRAAGLVRDNPKTALAAGAAVAAGVATAAMVRAKRRGGTGGASTGNKSGGKSGGGAKKKG